MTIKWVGSPNYTKGRSQAITTIVMHWMAGTLAGADAHFQNTAPEGDPNKATSAHYGIENKIIHQYVKVSDTAWHAIIANPYSIGIEHSAAPKRPASRDTINTAAALIARLCKENNIPIDRRHIIPHSQVVATQCPGTLPIDDIIKKAKTINQGASKVTSRETAIYLLRILQQKHTPSPAKIKEWTGLSDDQLKARLKRYYESNEYKQIKTATTDTKSRSLLQKIKDIVKG